MSSQQKKRVGLNSVISWGASVVIIGLMFKILHWQGGEFMIALGLLTESFLFFILGIASMAVAEEEKGPNGEKDGSALHDLLASNITPKVIESLSNGFKQFNATVAQVNLVAGSSNVTQNLIKEMETATGDVKKFRDGMTTASTGFGEFSKSIQSISQMSASSQAMMKDFDGASQGMKAFSKNITDMNSSFDQFNKTLQAINQMTASSQAMLKEFESATVSMRAYNKNLTDLSKVYQAQLDAFKR
jgi:gliding motility-associated protein GldL